MGDQFVDVYEGGVCKSSERLSAPIGGKDCHVPVPVASEVSTRPAPGAEVNCRPDILIVPATSSFVAGLAVPIPMLPLLALETSFPLAVHWLADAAVA